MSKRELGLFPDDGPPSKMLKEDEGSGRAGRVRKKSAKVLEMEEFEQAEKKTPAGKSPTAKKVKTPKLPSIPVVTEDIEAVVEKPKKVKPVKAIAVEPSPLPPPFKAPKVSFQLEPDLSSSPTKSSPTKLDTKPNVTNIRITGGGKIEPGPEKNLDSPVKKETKSVIKHLLNSPTAGSTKALATSTVSSEAASAVKKASKKLKISESETPKKKKQKKIKTESDEMSPPISSNSEVSTPSLKMKIISSSNPASALVSMGSPKNTDSLNEPKQKKVKKVKKVKTELLNTTPQLSDSSPGPPGSDSFDEGKNSPKKVSKKTSKKKEKLIQDAISSISAAKQMQHFATLATMQGASSAKPAASTSTGDVQKVQKIKKKQKAASPLLSGESFSDSSQIKSDLSFEDDDDAEDEVGLVIAETENKKKKTVLKKKASSGKGKQSSPSKVKEKGEEKNINKRAPTAYMMFCNATRPEIVNENPGIEFATISRKLGELWQGLSNKKKLAWRRKAQKKLKRGSNLISTGKVAKESQIMTAIQAVEAMQENKSNVAVTKSPRSGSEDTPQSPTLQNYSIEPIDVAAHLKLLGESLSIIGMRLQEHKGMIAVQGSLSVLLDSLLCSCGPLLSLTQQVPGMDGCPPLVHAKTLDSVAYVMPGL